MYTSIDRLTTLDVVGLMERLAEHFPWLSQCINEIDVTNIGVQHSLKQTLENAAKTFDIQLDEVGMETDLDLAVELPNPKAFKTAREHKKAHSHER